MNLVGSNMRLTTPYYCIDEREILRNLKAIEYVRQRSGAKVVLALKCFSTWCVFGLMRRYMDGTTSSSLFEARLGHEKFGKEVHAYSVAWTADEMAEVKKFAHKIIFNSVSQFTKFEEETRGLDVGVRVNPGVSYSHFDLADPGRRYSRLGVRDRRSLITLAPGLNGVMFHYNCENSDFGNFSTTLDTIGRTYGPLLRKLDWVSLGGGLYFTAEGYPLDLFCRKLRDFSDRFK